MPLESGSHIGGPNMASPLRLVRSGRILGLAFLFMGGLAFTQNKSQTTQKADLGEPYQFSATDSRMSFGLYLRLRLDGEKYMQWVNFIAPTTVSGECSSAESLAQYKISIDGDKSDKWIPIPMKDPSHGIPMPGLSWEIAHPKDMNDPLGWCDVDVTVHMSKAAKAYSVSQPFYGLSFKSRRDNSDTITYSLATIYYHDHTYTNLRFFSVYDEDYPVTLEDIYGSPGCSGYCGPIEDANRILQQPLFPATPVDRSEDLDYTSKFLFSALYNNLIVTSHRFTVDGVDDFRVGLRFSGSFVKDTQTSSVSLRDRLRR